MCVHPRGRLALHLCRDYKSQRTQKSCHASRVGLLGVPRFVRKDMKLACGCDLRSM